MVRTTGQKQKYLPGRDSMESKRLSDQHEVLLKAAGGYFPVPLSVSDDMIEAILDVGTGNAAWLLGLRQSGLVSASVELCGVDVSNQMMPCRELRRKFGLDLQVGDLCDPLPIDWNEKFDLIHGRHVLIWIEPHKWLGVLHNLKRALKPDGTLVIMYPGELTYDHRTGEPLGPETAPAKVFAAFLEYTASKGLPRRAAALLPDLLLESGFDRDSIISTTRRINLGNAEPDVALRSASARHLDFVFEMISNLNSSSKLGFPSPSDHLGRKKFLHEWREATQEGFYYGLHIVSARKPKK